MLEDTNKRIWLVRLTSICATLLLLTFLFVILRGIAWSPHEIETNTAEIELGSTKLIHQSGQRLWVSRLTDLQRQNLSSLSNEVFLEGGCVIKDELCLIDSATDQQGIIMIYLENKPDVLTDKTPWFGGFINPRNGAIYDLLGRLYRQSAKSEQLKKFINYRAN